MKNLLPGRQLRALAALIAAYAIALQAVFTTLAPVQVQADGSLAVYCFGNGATDSADPGAPQDPAPAAGKISCVLCGACMGGTAMLPAGAVVAALPVSRPISLAPPSAGDAPPASHIRAGPARAPPMNV